MGNAEFYIRDLNEHNLLNLPSGKTSNKNSFVRRLSKSNDLSNTPIIYETSNHSSFVILPLATEIPLAVLTYSTSFPPQTPSK